MKLSEAKKGLPVVFIPDRAKGNPNHKDARRGIISATTHQYIFVKFDDQIESIGWDKTPAHACYPRHLAVL